MSRSPVVSDTTPLISLAGIGLLDVLPRVYSDIWVPRAVVTEFQVKASPSDPQLENLPWLTIVDDVPGAHDLPRQGVGEAAAISLAESAGARLVILDERKARRIASDRGLVVVGTLAVLLRAKDIGIVAAIKPYIEAMEAQGRRLSESLVTQVLAAAGER